MLGGTSITTPHKSGLRQSLRGVKNSVVSHFQPRDANFSRFQQVDGDVWYASMFFYPNHWQPGGKTALPLPGSPYKAFCYGAYLGDTTDYIVTFFVVLAAWLWLAYLW